MDRTRLGSTLHHLSALVAPPGVGKLTDSELLSAYCAHHDQAAFAALVQRHGSLVLAVCGRVLRRVEDREDVFQATFLALARDAAKVRQRESIASWLHGVARHIALNVLRATTRRHQHEERAMTTPAPNPAFQAAWHEVQALLDEEIQRLPPRYREPFILCCLENHSRTEAAARLGVKEGTVGSRLTEARRRLRAQLARRGVELSAVLAATTVSSGAANGSVSLALAATVTGIAARMATGQALTRDVVSPYILSLVQGVPQAMFFTRRMIGILLLIAMGVVSSGVTAIAFHQSTPAGAARQGARVATADKPKPAAPKRESALWKAEADFRTPGWLPVSVAYSGDGKLMVVGGTSGKVVAIDPATRNEKWKTDVGGDFAALAFAADGKSVLATFSDGARFLDVGTGKAGVAVEEKNSGPTAIGVFPDKELVVGPNRTLSYHKIIFANRQHAFVSTWGGGARDKAGTIVLHTSAKDKSHADAGAVPLAVDPAGRSVIVTGPIDPDTGKNVLWAWVAGDREKDSPGNRILRGHDSLVVSAAWSKDGKTAVTGDAAGRVIVWDAKTMKESHRLELDGRVAAVAVSMDGKSMAAVAIGKQARFYLWRSKAKKPRPMQVDSGDYSGLVYACLTFSPDGQQLAGSAINMDWLNRLGRLVGTLHIWKAEKAKPEKEAGK